MVYSSVLMVAADEQVLEYSDPTKFHTPVHGPGRGSVVVLVGGMNGAVVVVVVATGTVVIVVGGEGRGGTGHIVSGPSRRHCRTRCSRQRLYFARRKRPHTSAMCGAHVERHSALEATGVASDWPLATTAARMRDDGKLLHYLGPPNRHGVASVLRAPSAPPCG